MQPMLAETLAPKDLDRVLRDDNWWAQQKLDGDRVMFHVLNGKVTALNRNGEIRVNLVPARVRRQFEGMPGEWVFDGELMADGTFWLFDMPVAAPHIDPSRPYEYRLVVLERFFAGWGPDPCIRLLPTARTTEAKATLIERTLRQDGEGVVLKDTAAPYRPGKRSTSMLKLKFWHSADCVVTAVSPEGRANCLVSMYEAGRLIEPTSVGTAGKARVHVGDVVEVKYLYATDIRQLFQPELMRVRDDKAPTECTADQLVFTNRDVVHLPEPPIGLVRQRRRTRSCGVLVEIHDAWHPRNFLGAEEGRWLTVCVDHGEFEGHRTLAIARKMAPQSDLWCPECRETVSG